ncbi:MAG: energy transducer TonB [Nitrospirota bacterium]
MNYNINGFKVSFLLHVIIIMLILGLSHSIRSEGKVVVIDFSIEGSTSTVKTDTRPVNQRHDDKRPIAQSRIAQVVQKSEPVPAVKNEMNPTESESQVPVPVTQKPADNTGTKIASLPALTDTGGSVTSSVISDENRGNSIENEKTKYLKEHFSYIRNMIQKNLSYPRIAREMGWIGKVTVSFIVCENGHVKDIKIVESSGVAILDKNAINTIKRVSPFPKPPVGAQIIIPVSYKLN